MTKNPARSAAARLAWKIRKARQLWREQRDWREFMEWGGPARVIKEAQPRFHAAAMKTNALYAWAFETKQ